MKRVDFLLASWVIYSDNYYGSKEYNGSLKIPDGDKAVLSVEPSLAELIRLLSNLQIRPTLSYHEECIARLLIMHPPHNSTILCFQ